MVLSHDGAVWQVQGCRPQGAGQRVVQEDQKGELQPGQADQRDQTRGIEGESSPSVLRSRSVFLPASFFFCWLRRNKKVGLKVTCRLNKSLKTPSYPSH